jgi:hypothetical protein
LLSLIVAFPAESGRVPGKPLERTVVGGSDQARLGEPFRVVRNLFGVPAGDRNFNGSPRLPGNRDGEKRLYRK